MPTGDSRNQRIMYSDIKSHSACKTLKILIVSWVFRPNVGGVETHLADLTEYLRSKGHTVHVLTYTPLTTRVANVPLREKLKGLEIYRIRWIGQGIFSRLEANSILWATCLFPPLFVYTLIFMLRHKVDVIHAHGLVAASIAGPLSKLFKTRGVVSLHGLLEQRSLLWLSRFVLMPFDSVLALSNRSKRDVVNAGVSKGKAAIYTHWVDQSLFRPPFDKNAIRRELGFTKGHFVILFVGRLYRGKGVEVLLGVAKKCPNDIRFIFVGLGPMEGEIRKWEEKLGNVKLIGKVPLETLANYYGAADFVVALPQWNVFEGFARVVLESLSCGTPVLVARALAEMIDESVGRLVYPDVMDLYRQIMHFYENREELEKLAESARTYAEERYSRRNAELVMKAYRGNNDPDF